ncbi:hypothetical protein ACHQM5_026538 [Ranunculus cassubicifolius]
MSSPLLFNCICSSNAIPHFALIQNKVKCMKTSALERRSSKATFRLGFVDLQKTLYDLQSSAQTFTSNEISIDNYIMVKRHDDKFRTSVQHIRDCISYPAALCSVHRVIQGYWVGPDIEDGYGYIEALVS